MNTCIVLCLFALVAVAMGRPNEKYTNKYDNVKIDEILENTRLLEAYVNCLLDKGKCTPEGNELKSHMQEALETKCEKCTEVQQKETRHVIGYLINEKPLYWKQLTEKYDPTKKYVTEYEDELKKIKA